MRFQSIIYIISLRLVVPATCYPQLTHQWLERRQDVGQIASEYDYIVVGGGQSGLVVANRLSEDSNSTVLVVEYGYFDNQPKQIQPSSAVVYSPQDLFNLTSVPQEGLGGSVQRVLSASVVGGGSTINGMMLNRGAADDYDNWAKLNDDPEWGFEGLLPYFIKSATFQPPSQGLAEQFNITWDLSVYGANSPIHVSIASFQYPGLTPQWQGLKDIGLVPQIEGANGQAYGIFWYHHAIDNTTVTRSYAVSGYYTPVSNRSNLVLLTGYRANEVVLDSHRHATGVRIQARDLNNSEVVSIKARKEIILAAGALHSPQILQRSGIGPLSLLKEAGIDVLLDLPGVGHNLQDHPVSSVSFNYTKNIDPNPQYMSTNQTFIDWAQEVWAANRTGPLTITTGNTVALVPLPQLSPKSWDAIADILENQNSSDFLPSTYTGKQLAGFEAQRALISNSLRRTDNAAVEVPFRGSTSFSTVLMKGASRGTVLLDPTDIYGEPILDFGTFKNPVDAYIMAESYEFVRRWHQAPIMVEVFDPVEIRPGADVSTLEQRIAHARNSTSSTTAHLSGTCAMMPESLGGVVGTDLRVYGVTGLSIADASIMPIIPGAHICATVYAVAEKAADIIKARHY